MTLVSNAFSHTVQDEMIFHQSDEQSFKVIDWHIDTPDCIEAGRLKLQDLNTNEIYEYGIWQGDEDMLSYYICLDCLEEEDEYETVLLEDLGIHILTFEALTPFARISAAQHFADEKRREGSFYTFQRAYRKLLKGRTELFEFDGTPAWYTSSEALIYNYSLQRNDL